MHTLVIVTALVRFATAFQASFQESVVFPHLLEERSLNGEKVLRLNDELTLNLKQKSAYPDTLLLRTNENDGTTKERYVSSAQFNEQLFEDRGNLAAVVLNQEDGLRVHGVIGDELRLKPLSTAERSADGQVPHLLYRADPAKTDTPTRDYLSVPLYDGVGTSHKEVLAEERSLYAIVTEVHLVIDAAYYRAYSFNQEEIIAYFGAAVNGINLRYTSVESPRVTIVIVGFTFNVQQEPYIRGFRNYAQYIDISSTLATLRDTYNLNSAFTNTVDLIFLISGLDLCGTANSLIECKIGGMAYLAGACTAHKYGVVEDKPRSYDVVRMMAHELGHSLGCVHDGEGPDSLMAGHPGASLCLWDYGYMMSYVQKDNNQYKFSPCCSQQIQFVSLQHTHGCLYKNDSGKTAATSPYLPGTNTTLDQLCHKSFGQDGLRYKFDTTRVPAGCQIPCISEKYMDGAVVRWKYGTATALDGSICDINDLSKICRNGECVHAVGYTQGAQPPPPIPKTQQPILPVATQRPEAGTTTRNLRIQWVYHWYPHLGWRLVPQYVAQ